MGYKPRIVVAASSFVSWTEKKFEKKSKNIEIIKIKIKVKLKFY